MKKRKIPMRKCVVSQEMKPKKELFRIVRTPEGDVCFDPTGKKSGRGTYLSKDEAIIEKAKKSGILGKQLKTEIPEQLYNDLFRALLKEKGPIR